MVIDMVSAGVNDTVNHMANVSTSAVNKESAMRKTTRHQPPSRIRYNQANPVIGVRVDRPTYTRLLALRETTGLSFGALFKDALGAIEKDVNQIRRRAREEGKVIGEDRLPRGLPRGAGPVSRRLPVLRVRHGDPDHR